MISLNLNLMKLKDFAKLIGVPESTVRTWKRRDQIPNSCFLIIGSTIFVKVNEFQEWTKNAA